MSTLKKILALTLAIAMVLSLNVFAAFKDQDKINEDCVSAMEMMNTLGIMLGDENNNANPAKTITRAEAAAMIFRLMNKGNADASMYNGMKVFTDVASGIWYEGYVNYCYTMGIVQGRTATTFDPSAPVTGYEIAKMLLTCLKYNAEKQGYTGANWAKNVQNDAFAANLLEDYGMGLALPAQRQWVAVMFNQSLNCFVAKYYLGELEVTEKKENTLGYRNFGLETETGILQAAGYVDMGSYLTVGAKEEQTDYSFVSGEKLGKLKFKANPKLLGQSVEVVYNSKTGKVYGINASGDSVVGDTKVDGITFKSSSSKYTFGTLTGKLDTNFAIYMTKFVDGDVTLVEYTKSSDPSAAARLAAVVEANHYNMGIRAVDQDNDGDIDFALLQTYAIIEVATISHSTSTDKWTINGTTYAKDLLVGADKIEKDDVVMVTPNVADQTLELNALTPTTAATLTRQTAGSSYTIGGKTYKPAGALVIPPMSALSLGTEYVVYTDGVYAVKITTVNDKITELPNMALVTALGHQTNAYGTTTHYVKVLTLDGKVTEYEYDDNDVTGAILAGAENTADTLFHKTNNKYDNVGQVFIYGVNKDGTVYFKPVTEANIPSTYDVKSASSIGGNYSSTKGLMGSYRMAADTKLFVTTGDATPKYKVMSLSELNKQIVSGSLFVYAPSGKIGTVMGGSITLNTTSTSVASDAAYAIVTDVYTEWDATENDTVTKADVILADGSTKTMIYTGDAPVVGTAYKYTLTADEATFAASELTVARLTVIDGNYMTIGEVTQVASADIVVVLNDGDTIEVSALDKLDLDKTCNAQIVTNSKTGEVTLLYVVYAD